MINLTEICCQKWGSRQPSVGLCHLVQLLDDGEDEEGCEETDACQNAPDDGQVLAPEITWNLYEEVAKGCGNEPATHHHASILGRSYLGDEGNADRGEEQLCKGEHQICADEQIGRHISHVEVGAFCIVSWKW